MKSTFTKQAITTIIVVATLAVALLGFFIFQYVYDKNIATVELETLSPKLTIIGSSVENRKIEAFSYGTGEKHLVFVGGIHGGYEWNSVLLAYEMINYLKANPKIIPQNLTITIIPSANPDGVYEVIGKEGPFSKDDVPTDVDVALTRFNANEVDLNRNFDCKWQPKSTWRNKTVNAGTSAFSEPEAQAIRNFVLVNNPTAVIFWHSQANAVYASECDNGVLSETLDIMNIYSEASGYSAVDSFDSYEVTGDAEGWLASINIPAITVELKNHQDIDWNQNLAGIKALFKHYGKEKVLYY